MKANHANDVEQQKKTLSTDDACNAIGTTVEKGQEGKTLDKASIIINKVQRMIQTCNNKKQAKIAERYLNLACEMYPHIDFWEFRKELKILFDENYYEHKMLSKMR